MNKLIKLGLASLMVFTIGCSSKKNDSQTESNTTAQQTENSSKKEKNLCVKQEKDTPTWIVVFPCGGPNE